MRKKVGETLTPLVSTLDGKMPIIDVSAVKEIIGNAKICSGCLSEICRMKQRVAMKTVQKKLVNKGCQKGRLLVGNKDLIKI